jgi:hypothetical protein
LAKISKSTQLVIAVGVIAITYFALYGSEDTAKPRSKKPRATASTSSKPGQFTDEDYKAKFPPLNSQARNAFMPIIARTGSTLEAAEGPTGIPADLADGETGWTYTGTVEVNGVLQALLENPTSGAGDFVQIGQVWKKARVVAIAPEAILLKGPAGIAKTIRLHGSTEFAAPSGGMSPARVRPPISGPIGPLTVRPEQPSGRNGADALEEGTNNAN